MLRLPTLRWLMVQRPFEDVSAELFPVRSSVGQVQMPDLIDVLRRCHGMASADGEVEEAAVFLDRVFGKGSAKKRRDR